ncbi:hypothetical protein COU15_02790 [Candidatus Kaiserbacteria bacterium CG10_big_fil_rev_8_21_14_0_10_45_20]|uniref:Ig-like domain-containing protein n=1 Tax=Candidatus Kaiserbacteria bacterium CG10_big_fil_rev_8_21_14_0_10_45_20 TaxID=1974607 RepID=A0A2H0UHC0_9BACT|nr:MAG: hypothetical protein COU15_02790 [Candidatus Kaiserbacteria bacterium CG10_big_fil_rev_8_21_14_0_10_45_20]
MLFPLVLLVFLLAPLPTVAVTFPVLEDPLTVEVVPTSPVPGQVVQVRSSYFAQNPEGVHYSWSVNGRTVDQGVGVKNITVEVGPLGSRTSVSLTVTENGVVKGQKTVAIQPADVDIVWEADTAHIPFVSNRPLPNADSTIVAVAVPHIVRTSGTRVSANDLVYSWKINRSSTPSLVGYGKNVFTFSSPQFKNQFSVGVTVTTREGDITAEKSITITPVEPSVLFYENAPLLGTRFDRAINDELVLSGEEVTVSAYPLSLSGATALQYEWRANGRVVEASPEDPRTITFRKTGEGRGYFTIELSVSQFQALFNRVKSSFLLTF